MRYLVPLSLLFLGVFCNPPESHQFDAEVDRILDIIINSLYKTKEIFLRELISNASDACEKSRRLSLTDPSYYDQAKLQISVSSNRTTNEFVIEDNGLGMSKEDMISSLGTLAKSGTKEFLEKLGQGEGQESNLIGNFGVGFYSSFLVADKVTVVSKKHDGPEFTWSCANGDGKYYISESSGTISGTQGTRIILHMKANVDDNDYFDTNKVKDLIHKYSGFISFPIFLQVEKTHTTEEPVEEAPEEATEEKKLDIEEGAEEKPKTKTVTHTTLEWIHVNSSVPLILRNPKDVTVEEYNSFYRNVTAGTTDPLFHYHSKKVDGLHTSFRTLLLVPPKAPFQAFTKDEPVDSLSIYLKRVLICTINDLPRYVSFIKGFVDVDNIPLNVSRETLQKHQALEDVKRNVVSRTISMMEQMSKNETLYTTFYKEYSGHIKLGVLTEEDASRKKQLTHLLRYHTNVSGARNFTSLDDYCSRMKPNQTEIYFVTGSRLSEMKKLPYVEKVKKRGYEVVYMNEQPDEYVVQTLTTYTPTDSEKSYTLKNIAKSGLTFADETDDEKQKLKEADERFAPLKTFLQKKFAKTIEKVTISNLLEESPMAVVSSSFGWSPEMKRLMRDNKNDPMSQFFAMQKEIIEINPSHPVIISLLEKVSGLKEGESLPEETDLDITMLFDAAMLHSGYDLKDPALFARRVEDMIRTKYGMEKKPEEEPSPAEEMEEEPAFPDFSSMGGMDMPEMDLPEDEPLDMPQSQPEEKEEL